MNEMYTIVETSERLLDDDGVGILNWREAKLFIEGLKGNQLGHLDSINTQMNDVACEMPPAIFIPNSTNFIAFSTKLPVNLIAKLKVDCKEESLGKVFVENVHEGRYVGGLVGSSLDNSDNWIDFQKSHFNVIKSVSVMPNRTPNIVSEYLKFANKHELEAKKSELSTLRPIVPNQITLKSNHMPLFFRFGSFWYFKISFLDMIERKFDVGLSRTEYICSIEAVRNHPSKKTTAFRSSKS